MQSLWISSTNAVTFVVLLTSRSFTGGPVSQQPREGAFQLYNVAKVELVAKIPNNIPFFDACVLPVAFSTAITGLCAPVGQGLGLPFPSLDPKPCGKTVVIWGASASTGILFLQIARAAGIETIAVASASNHELCKSHGAAVAVNHREPSVVEQVADAIKEVGGDFVGIVDCVSDPETSLPHCTAVLQKVGGGQLGLLLPDMQMKAPENVRVTNIFGVNDITHQFWRDYLNPALEQGKLKCAPGSLVVGEGLESLQKALDVQRKGVSAKKVVVTL